jgi:rod shape-determining protein MreB and related proteins
MLKDVFNILWSDLAIDLGTANTLVYEPGKGILLDEPSVVAMSQIGPSREVIAVGAQAKSMIGRTPRNIKTIRPMQDGVIADFVATEKMIKQFIKTAINRMSLASPRVMMCVPASATQVEVRAMYDAARIAGARKIHIMQEPVAAAIGAGLDISQPCGTMVIDIGGGTTDIAVLSLGGIISSHSFRVGGDAMDRAIIDFIRREHQLLIGQSNAEIIKKEVGTALLTDENQDVDVYIKGRNLRTGLPSEIVIGPADIAKALHKSIEMIAEEVLNTLEGLPPEIAADIIDNGVHLTGGGALLDKIDVVLAEKIGVQFDIPADPLRCVVIGAGLALENIDQVGNLLIDVQ